MNYEAINRSILNKTELPKEIRQDTQLYEYLLNNKVAYFYAIELGNRQDSETVRVIDQADRYQRRYAKTLKLLDEVCKEKGYEYLLYKTYKFIPEMVDGDIDIIVREKDFQNFLNTFQTLGFECEEDEPGKGKCEKVGFSVIEPHTNISWRGGSHVSESFIWEKPIDVKVDGLVVKNVSLEIEATAIAAKILFEPSYLDLYSLLLLRYCLDEGINENLIYKNTTQPNLLKEVLEFCKDKAITPPYGKKWPLFLPVIRYIKLWTQNYIATKNHRIYVLHLVFYIYWNARYRINGKLPFTHHHEWQG